MKEAVIFNNSIVGYIIDDNVYESMRNTKTHYFVIGKGYPISTEILRILSIKNIQTIRIIERGAKGINVYECPLVDYLQAPEFQVGGFEKQRCFPISKMRKLK